MHFISAKAGAAFASIFAIIGTSVYVYGDEIMDFVLNKQSYLLAQVSEVSNLNINNETLYGGNKNINDKKFSCKLNTINPPRNSYCDVYSIQAFDNKMPNLDFIKNSKVLATMNSIKMDHYFKIKLDNKSLKSIIFNGNSTVELLSKKDNKLLAKMKFIYKVIDGQVVQGRTSLLIGKIKNNQLNNSNDDSELSANCSFKQDSKKQDCLIYKIENQPKFLETYKDIDIKTMIGSKKSDFNEKSKDDFFVIDLKNNTFDIAEFIKDKDKTIYAAEKSDPSKTIDFYFVDALSHQKTFFNESHTIILS